jgi:hypothetical protein
MLSLQRTARHVREARALDRGDSSFHRSRGVMHTVLYCTVDGSDPSLQTDI